MVLRINRGTKNENPTSPNQPTQPELQKTKIPLIFGIIVVAFFWLALYGFWYYFFKTPKQSPEQLPFVEYRMPDRQVAYKVFLPSGEILFYINGKVIKIGDMPAESIDSDW